MSVGRNLLVGTSIAVLVAATAVFAIAPLYTGSLIEQDFRNSIAQSMNGTTTGVQAMVERYDRGWRSSSAVTHWTVVGAPIDFRLRHEITHGPNPQFAVARIETTPVIPTSAQAEVQRLFKGPPLTATTLIGSSGEITTNIVSPAAAMTPSQDPNIKVGWGGMNALLTQRGDRFTLSGQIPSIAVANDVKQEQLQIAGIRIEGNTTMNATGMPLVGAGAVTMDSMALTTFEAGTLKVGATRLASRSDERSDVLDMQFAFSSEGITASGSNSPPLRITRCDFEYRLRNIDKASYLTYQQTVGRLFSGPGDPAQAAEAAGKAMAAASELLRGVAARSPIMEIPKFHIAFEQGAVDGTLSAQFNGSDLSGWPPAMDEALRRTTINANVRAPESLLRMVAATRARESAVQMLALQSTEATEENIRNASVGIVEQQMQMLAQMPYVRREGSDYATSLVLQGGELKVNGQPLLGGAAGLGSLATPPTEMIVPQDGGLATPADLAPPAGD